MSEVRTECFDEAKARDHKVWENKIFIILFFFIFYFK